MLKRFLIIVTTVSLMLTSVTAAADTGIVTAGVLNVRMSPSSSVIGQLHYGDSVNVIGYENNWCRIQYNGTEGYVFGSYINIIAAAAEVAAEASPISTPTAGENILAYAKNFLGVPYVYGGSSPAGFDCSGFVKYVYANFGITLPRTSYGQMNSGYAVSTADLQIGDILVFRGGGHVGIYAGNNTYIHAPQTGRTVSIDPINRPIIAARRVL